MSRLNDLLRELRTREPALARDLEREVSALADRRSFGLNFERHVPEVVELPGRKVRQGDKVRILPPRGHMPTKSDEKLWQVLRIDRAVGAASVVAIDGVDMIDSSLDDLVVVAEFRDPIYPGLVSTGKVERGEQKPVHTVIKAENYHALETLLFTDRGAIDAIYIDPPYNSGTEGWIYNDRYVAADDLYAHSKWLAFIERRLLLAKELLRPQGIIIVAIGDDEHHRLRLLMEQVFEPQNFISSIVWQGGRKNDSRYVSNGADYMLVFARDEAELQKAGIRWRESKAGAEEALERAAGIWSANRGDRDAAVKEWRAWLKSFRSKGVASDAVTRFVNLDRDGRPIRTDADLRSPTPRPNLQYELLHPVTRQPVRMHPNGWRYSRETMNEMIKRGLISFGPDHTTSAGGISYLDAMDTQVPESVFVRDRNSSGRQLKELLGDRRFPNPKDCNVLMRWLGLVAPKNGVILDFFAGSGTTAEAVMRLNENDGGTRRSILVTNNEVASTDARKLRQAGFRPGDLEWESHGVYEHVARPRIEAAVQGRRADGTEISQGLSESVEFLTLTYEAPLRISSNREFARIAPILWMRAGCRGRRIDNLSAGWDVAESYGVLTDLDNTEEFLKAIAANDRVKVAFIVTDEDRLFESVAQELPDQIEPVRLYEAYLRNFEIESGRGAL